MISKCQYFWEIKYTKDDLHICGSTLNEQRGTTWNNIAWKQDPTPKLSGSSKIHIV